MINKILLAGFCSAFIFSGCTVIKIPEASGGSRSDGIVELSYDYGDFESPDVQWDKAQTQATARCKAWGYKSAQRFNRGQTECQFYNRHGCYSWNVKIKYQCM